MKARYFILSMTVAMMLCSTSAYGQFRKEDSAGNKTSANAKPATNNTSNKTSANAKPATTAKASAKPATTAKASAKPATTAKASAKPATDNKAKSRTSKSRTTAKEPNKVTPPREIPRGYEDKVRYDGKNWRYLRDGKWYTYDRYIEPDVYYSRPLSEFGAALVVGTLVGCIVSALVK